LGLSRANGDGDQPRSCQACVLLLNAEENNHD